MRRSKGRFEQSIFYKITLRNKILGTGLSFLILFLISYYPSINFPNPIEIRIILIASFIWLFIFTIATEILKNKGYSTRLIRYPELIIGSILLGAFIHFFGGLNGPFIFVYSFSIIGAAYNLEFLLPFIIAAIGGILIIAEFIFLVRSGEIIFDFLSFFQMFLRIIFLFFIANYSQYLIKIFIQEKQEREKVNKLYSRLQKNYRTLKELDEAKDTFVSIASHQLRTPLAQIEGYLSMILEKKFGKIPRHLKKPFDKLYTASKRMKEIVENILTASALDAKKLIFKKFPVDLLKIIRSQMEFLKKDAKDKRLNLKLIETREKIPKIKVDPEKIKYVIENLVSNAIKYTPKGEIEVRIYKQKRYIIFEVSDSGIGVPRKEQKYLFTKFFRASNAKAINPSGMGMGLYVSKSLVEGMNGQIIFKSSEGKGSTFGFKFLIS